MYCCLPTPVDRTEEVSPITAVAGRALPLTAVRFI